MALGSRIRRAIAPTLRARVRATERAYGSTSAQAARGGYGGGLTQGGIVNPVSGLGTELDKSEAAVFYPTRISYKSPLEILYVQSWAAAKFCRVPVEDMFQLPRNWKDGDVEGSADVMSKAEERHCAISQVREAMILARLYGSAMAVLITNEAPLDTELVPERVREGDLSAIHVFDRYDTSVIERDNDIYSPNFGLPLLYRFQPPFQAAPLLVHHSRVLRFDGIPHPGTSPFYNYDTDWSVSNLVPLITSLLHDASFASAVAHMAQEASIPILKIADFHDLISGTAGESEMDIDALGRAMNKLKSVFRMFLMDKDESEFERVAIQFGGLAELMDIYHVKIAAAGDIPVTRFMMRSPAGMNATGDSDWRNYVTMMESKRTVQTADTLPILDEVIARDAGLREVPEFEWQSMLEASDKDKAEIAKLKAEALKMALDSNAIDEDEFRRALDGNPVFGELPGDAPEVDDDPAMLPGFPGQPGGPAPLIPPEPPEGGNGPEDA